MIRNTTLKCLLALIAFNLAPLLGETTVKNQTTNAIPGYTYGSPQLAKSPLSLADFELLKKTVLFSAEDEKYLKMAGVVLADQIDAVLDLWYGFVGGNDHLLHFFTGSDRKPDAAYLAAVRQRFGQWIKDTCNPPYDQVWLDYQYEIALRHHKTKKGKTDGVKGIDNINQRYLIAFIYPITATIKPFLSAKGHTADEVDKMHQAWFKSVVLQVTLWTQPYAKNGEF